MRHRNSRSEDLCRGVASAVYEPVGSTPSPPHSLSGGMILIGSSDRICPLYKFGRQFDAEGFGPDTTLCHDHGETTDQHAVNLDRACLVVPCRQTLLERRDVLIQARAGLLARSGNIDVVAHLLPPMVVEEGASTVR